MAYYMFQLAITPDTFKAMMGNPQDRRDAARKIIEAHGGRLHEYFFAFGSYDVIVIAEVPDNASAAAIMMTVAASGAFARGETTVLMTVEEGMNALRKAGAQSKAYSPPGR